MMRTMSIDEPPRDHADGAEAYDEHDAAFTDRERIKATWLRLLFMVILALIFSIGVFVGVVVSLLQFGWVLFTGETKKEFSTIGRQLAEYAREISLYMTFNTDERPFPFDREWPSD
jgi:flagellar biosynthesis protein FlhB